MSTDPDSTAARAGDPRPPWVDGSAYPFESHVAVLDEGRMHYVDEGAGRPVVFLHGNPTWSFLYRTQIERLSAEYRCIAPDYLGFGLSENPRDWSYRVPDHARVVERFLDRLDLDGAALVVHDWGGPIGMRYAMRRRAAVDAFVILNTAMWPMRGAWRLRAFSRAMDTPVAAALNRRYNVPADWLMPLWFGDRSRFTETARRHYREPMRDPVAREAARRMARDLLGASDWLETLWDQRDRVADRRALLCWGMRDPVFPTAALRRWQALFPRASTAEFPTAGHFVQEERATALTRRIREFLGGLPD